MKLIIFGGDGFCAWPAALHLSAAGHEVVIVDNFSRRRIDEDLGISSLTPIASLQTRLLVWNRLGGCAIRSFLIDTAEEPDRVKRLLEEERPDAVLHYAEQRAAPVSMKNAYYKRYTLCNNLASTFNILEAIVETGRDVHLIHFGSMGVYGYLQSNCRVPEGYLEVPVPGSSIPRKLLYLGVPASIYHVTKMQDALMFQFYNCTYGVRITDLHQGVVWGTWTEETRRDERLINRFDYDGDYGTFVNRFLMQAALDYPLTVYGAGGQCRPIIHIRDSVCCVELALDNPPRTGDPVHIYNQTTEVYQVREIARIVSEKTGVPIQTIPNPRVENEETRFLVDNGTLLSLGLKPTLLRAALMEEVMDVARRYRHRCDFSRILPSSHWKSRKPVEHGRG